MFAQVDEFHNFTFLEWLAPLDLQMPWLEQGALPRPPRKWAYPEMCSSNQADGSESQGNMHAAAQQTPKSH
jgi:hypothetical protein